MLELLFITYILSSLWAITTIIMFGNRPSRSIAWLVIVIALPIFGVILYVLFGINRKRFKFFTLNNILKRRLYDLDNKIDTIEDFTKTLKSGTYSKISRLMLKSSGFPMVSGNHLEVLESGKNKFDLLFEAIENAKTFIHLQYYIIAKGVILEKLIALLQKKLKEGVEVRIIYDAFGSYGWRHTVKTLKNAGANIYPILPFNIKNILSTLNYRNHRKLAVIDGDLAFMGGINITDKYIDEEKSSLGIWEDLHLKLEGPVVDHLHRVFIKDYYFASGESLVKNKKYLPKQHEKGEHLLQVVSGGPDLDYSSILHQYVMMIHCAETSIKIQNPYFIPNKKLTEALKMSALRGVDVKIMVPEEIDSKIAKYCMYSNFEGLLKAGVNICVEKEKFFHSKLIIIDDCIASIGSGNFDYRSFEHNYELNTIIYNQDIAKRLSKDFNALCENSHHLDYEVFKNRSVKDKLLQGMARIFSPLL